MQMSVYYNGITQPQFIAAQNLFIYFFIDKRLINRAKEKLLEKYPWPFKCKDRCDFYFIKFATRFDIISIKNTKLQRSIFKNDLNLCIG